MTDIEKADEALDNVASKYDTASSAYAQARALVSIAKSLDFIASQDNAFFASLISDAINNVASSLPQRDR